MTPADEAQFIKLWQEGRTSPLSATASASATALSRAPHSDHWLYQRCLLRILLWMVCCCAGACSGVVKTASPPPAWSRVPETLEKEEVLWEGPLRPAPDRDFVAHLFESPPLKYWLLHLPPGWFPEEELRDYQKAHGLPETGQIDETTAKALGATWGKVQRDPAVVSIGRPQAWPLTMVLSPQEMSPLIQARLKEVDFYLIQLFCSFRPAPGETRIESARFIMYLLPDLMGRQPIALDLIPKEITQEVKRYTKFTLAPTLKFQEVEIQGANIEWGIEYRELEPVILAAGLGEPIPTWTYYTAKGIRSVQGGKGMYLIVEAPKGMRTAYAELRLEADIRAEGILSRLWDYMRLQRRQERLNVRLW